MEQELLTLSDYMSSPRVCSGVHVARSLVFCVVHCISKHFGPKGQATMDFHIVKMFKDKEVNKNVKNSFYQCVT